VLQAFVHIYIRSYIEDRVEHPRRYAGYFDFPSEPAPVRQTDCARSHARSEPWDAWTFGQC